MVALFFEDLCAVSTKSMQGFYLARASISVIVTKAVFTEVKCCMFVVGNATFPMTSNTDGYVYLLPFACIF